MTSWKCNQHLSVRLPVESQRWEMRNAVVQICTYMKVSKFCLCMFYFVACQVMLLSLDKPAQVWYFDDLLFNMDLQRVGESSEVLEVARPFESTTLEEILGSQARPARIWEVDAMAYVLYLSDWTVWLHAYPPTYTPCLFQCSGLANHLWHDRVQPCGRDDNILWSCKNTLECQNPREFLSGIGEQIILKVVTALIMEVCLVRLEMRYKCTWNFRVCKEMQFKHLWAISSWVAF